MAQSSTVIFARNLTRSLPLGDRQIDILKGVTLEVERGEWLALTGPSGSGKSTLLGLLAGIDTPTSGSLIVDGIDITRLPESKLARVRNDKIGIVFQSFHLIPTLTARENVEVPLYVNARAGRARQLAEEMLTLVGLHDRMNHRPHQLSGGEQQRVAIARALINRPSILLADEPTGNLDTRTGDAVLELIGNLRRELGLTVVMVTHDPLIARAADREVHLLDGRLVDGLDSRPASARAAHPVLAGRSWT